MSYNLRSKRKFDDAAAELVRFSKRSRVISPESSGFVPIVYSGFKPGYRKQYKRAYNYQRKGYYPKPKRFRG